MNLHESVLDDKEKNRILEYIKRTNTGLTIRCFSTFIR